MKRKYINDIQKHGLRLSLCAISLGLCPTAFAQTENDGEEVEMTIKKPTRQREVKDNFATTMLHGVVVDQVSKKPLAGIQLKVLGYDRYSAMTGADGKFTIKVPEFATTLFVHSPSFMSQQVAINAKDTEKEIKVLMMQEKFRPMYSEGTTYTAQAGFDSDAKDVTIESDIENILGADVRTVTRSAAPGIGASMFVRGLSSINANAQPLIVVDGVEQDMQQNRLSLHS